MDLLLTIVCLGGAVVLAGYDVVSQKGRSLLGIAVLLLAIYLLAQAV